MVGIHSYGAYIPMWRMPLAALGGGARKIPDNGPEKAVANYDEDAITMAVAAATDCLEGIDRQSVDGVIFSSTTYPYKEKQGASIIAKALDLRRDVQTADLGGSLRASAGALRVAADTVRAGSAHCVLVIASDCRIGAPRSGIERNVGDGAAAFLISDNEVAVSLEGTHAISDEILDVWRTEGDPFVHSWEDRFVVEHGYSDRTVEAVRGLCEKLDANPGDFTRVALYAPDARSHGGVAKSLGISKEALVDPLFGRLGNAGVAFAPLLLAQALESARSGDRILMASYGDGAEALSFAVTDRIEKIQNRRGVAWHLTRKSSLRDYDMYLRFRQLDTKEWEAGTNSGISATIHFRDRDEDLSFRGHQCRQCSTMQYPFQRVCFRCYARDDFDEVRLADRKGSVKSFSFDFFAGSPNPPLVATMTEVDGGSRVYLQMTDCSPKEVKLDMPVEFTFRKIHEIGGKPNYFWKCTPIREEAQ